MRRFSIIGLVLLCLLSGCTQDPQALNEQNIITPALPVYGDVINTLTLQNWSDFAVENVEWQEKSIYSLPLTDIIAQAQPYSDHFSVFIKGNDGVATEISDLTGAYLTWSPTAGWQLISNRHPVSAGIKNITSIIVVNQQFDWEHGFYVLTSMENLLHFTVGKLLTGSTQTIALQDGTSQLGDVKATAYRFKTVVPLAEHLAIQPTTPLLIFSEPDQQYRCQANGYLELQGNVINYADVQGKTLVRNVKGIMLNPPTRSIMDVFNDVEESLALEQRVMVILLDGVGAEVYKQAIQAGLCPHLSSLPGQEQAVAVYPPITPAGMTAMITGQPPAVNGVTERNQHDILVADIFNLATEKSLTALLVEGDAKIINTSIEPRLNLDLDEDGTTDQEVLTAAKEAIAEEPALLMVHFHGTDDLSHTYGPQSAEAFARLQLIDSYVGELMQLWNGHLIVTADHGQHSTTDPDRLGSHGQVRYEDLMVPYLTR